MPDAGAAVSSAIVVLGRVVGAYGVRGWLRIHPFGDDPEAWGEIATWWLCGAADVASGDSMASSDRWMPCRIECFRIHGSAVLAKLRGIDERGKAEALRGSYLGVPREALPQTAAGEYYWGDLIGLQVVGRGGARLGSVSGLLESGAHDVLVVRNEIGEERLLPFVGAVVKTVDVAAGVIEADWSPEW
jgi:16S rRNA processing protein RimM